jgi:hypothetical protein
MITKHSHFSFVPQIVCIAMLLWALNPANPYEYYVLLRIVLCALCAYLAFRAVAISKREWVWILGVIAFVYNPIIRLHLNRGIWSAVNVVTIIVLIVTIWTLRISSKQTKKKPE